MIAPELFQTHPRVSAEPALRCPACENSVGRVDPTLQRITCPRCRSLMRNEKGIWRCLLPERAAYFERFAREYETVRSQEGRGSTDAAYYLALPFQNSGSKNSFQWSIRSRTYEYTSDHLLPAIERKNNGPLDILDLGAGNCWLSYRLALKGHRPVATDLLTNDSDGLGAAKWYESRVFSLFPRFQAELDRLPFLDSQFDCAIFNASFHYSEDYARTLAEAIRCLRPGGTVIIADTAWYRSDASGQRMIEERRAAFQQQYGFPSDALHSLEYLTDQRLQGLERKLGIHWSIDQPFYGVRWHLRPLFAALRRKREPSRFRIYSAEVRK
jgi:SAM-dependent methyltransferase